LQFVLFGLAKSGTTALFYKVRNSLPPGTIALFEPGAYGPRDRALERLRVLRRGHFFPDVLAKVLPCGPRPVRVEDFDRFERQVLVVRDPRDRLVSDLLYRGYNAALSADETAAAPLEILRLIRLKEAEPGAVPLLDLLRAYDRLEGAAGAPTCWRERYHAQGVLRPLHFHHERPRLPVFRYEQLVEGAFGALEAILGIPLGGSAQVPSVLGRVVRSKAYGAWRNWFTRVDVDALRPLLQPYLDRYYPGADWDLAASPRLDPGDGSVYAGRVIDERRALAGLPPLPVSTG